MADDTADRDAGHAHGHRAGHGGQGEGHAFNPEHLLAHEARWRTLFEPADLLRGLLTLGERRVVDIGAGVGFWAIAAATLLPDAEVVAVDRQADMVQVLERRFRAAGLGNARAMQGEAERLDLASASVDAVLMTLVLHDIERPEQALAEARRVLQPAGRLVLIEFDPDAPGDGPPRHRLFRPDHLTELVGRCGLAPEPPRRGPGPLYQLVARPL